METERSHLKPRNSSGEEMGRVLEKEKELSLLGRYFKDADPAQEMRVE